MPIIIPMWRYASWTSQCHNWVRLAGVNANQKFAHCLFIPDSYGSGGGFLTVFILEQVLAGSVSEASKYRVLEAPFRRWFHNFPAPFQDRTGTLSVTASDSSHALPRLRSIGSIGKSSYFTFLTSNLWLLLFSGFITYTLQGTLPHIADDIRQVYLHPYIYTCLFSHRHLSCFHHLGQQLSTGQFLPLLSFCQFSQPETSRSLQSDSCK